MQSDPRQAYLSELGLTLWRLRDDDIGDAAPQETLHGEQHPAVASPSEPAPVPDTRKRPEPAEVRESVEPPPTLPEAGPQPAQATSAIENMDWGALEAELGTRDHRGASRPVFGVGAKDASLLIVGEAPGAEEDRRGEPFVGRAGKLLDRMLFAIGHSRAQNTYIANICKFRPPDNRDPKPEEVAADRPFLERQIALLQPRLIVAVGRVAAQTLLGSSDNLGKMRGREYVYPNTDIPVRVTYHPAYLLRSPNQKAKAWDDLKVIAQLLTQTNER